MIILEKHTVPPGQAPARLSDYANGLFESIPSRKGIRKAIERGEVLLDGEVGQTGTWVAPGQLIQLLQSEQVSARIFELKLEVLYEDDHLAVIFKPGGYPVSGNQFQTIQQALPFNLQPSTLPGRLPAPLPVHRLDSPTSGLLLVAKERAARIELGQQFEEKKVQKRYEAIVIGEIAPAGIINTPIDDKPALTRFKLLKTGPSLKSGTLSWLALWPVTGRTHQLRRHLFQQGTPILGDSLYARDGLLLKGKGLFLTAVELTFRHPARPETMRFHLPAPNKFDLLLEREERRWRKYHPE